MLLSRTQLTAVALLCAVALGTGVYFWKSSPKQPALPSSVASVMPKDMLAAMAEAAPEKAGKNQPGSSDPVTGSTFTGNGRDKLRCVATNSGKRLLRIELKAGEVYENGKNCVVILRGCNLEVPPGKTAEQTLVSAATSLESAAGEAAFTKSTQTFPKLDPLLRHLESHPDVSPAVAQAAVLALVENSPVEIFAKFPQLERQRQLEAGDFKMATADLVTVLQLLREIGGTPCALADDPQLKIEAMMDPRAHAAAMLYYGIGAEEEWGYWKHELLDGEPTTRHYALYGIARFHPEVALQMMPKWVRETRTAAIYRQAALGALALTHKAEAEPILRALQQEFAQEATLRESSDRALRYLEANLNRPL